MPDRLGQLTVDMAVKWSQPWEWLLVNHRDGIYDSATRGVDRSLDWLQIAMLYSPARHPKLDKTSPPTPTADGPAGSSPTKLSTGSLPRRTKRRQANTAGLRRY